MSGLSRALEKQAVAHLHDVGLVNRGHTLTTTAPRVVERKFRDPRRGARRDDLQAFDDARDHFVLEAGVQILRVLADDDEIDAVELGGYARQIPNWPEIHVQVEPLSEAHVHAGEPFT